MAERLAFVFGKDPATARGGDVTMFRLLRSIAEERYETELICLSERPDLVDDPRTTRIRKPPVNPPALLVRSAARRRSLVHTRFDVDGIRDAVTASEAERFVSVHSYLAEPVLRSPRVAPGRDLLISTEVSEAEVWRARGPLGRFEARRIERDEARVAAAARAVATYDGGLAGRPGVHWLPVTLPPVPRVDPAAAPPRLAFLGNRTWPPNARAAARLLDWWPRISAGIPGAELVLVGDGPRLTGLPPSVTDRGQVTDVETVLRFCRALVAPIDVGGGVRVKFLEAAARGLPVVTTPEGVGPIEASLGIEASPDEQAFIARCRRLLVDAELVSAVGSELHATNQRLWEARGGRDAVLQWLAT